MILRVWRGIFLCSVGALAQEEGIPPLVLPSDTVLHPSWASQGLSVDVRHEFDRTVVRPGIAWQDSLGGALVELLDTSCLVHNPTPSRLDGEHGLHLSLSRPLLSGTGVFSWQQLAQFEGQMADSSAIAGSHSRGRVLAGWERPWDAFRWGGWLGLLWEYSDPSVGNLSLVPDKEASRGATATAVGELEAGWSMSEIGLPREIATHVQRDQGDAELREESADLRARWATRETMLGHLLAEGTLDAARRRSEMLGFDRDLVHREASLTWGRGAFGQELSLRSFLADTASRDYTGRVPGEDSWGLGWNAGLKGVLPAGFSHRHDVQWGYSDRSVMDVDGHRGDLERSQSSENRMLLLADTLGWATGHLGGLRIQAGWQRSLAQNRHPENPEPGVSDRPDQDVSETGLGASLRDSALARGDKPLFSWSWLGRDEVYLRAVRSAETRRLEGHRLSFDLGLRPAQRVGLELGSNAREQRTTYRFDSTRNAGLMEWQWDCAIQEGPSARPNLRFWVEQRRTWTGGLEGEDFAVENRTILWKPGARTWWRLRKDWALSPWVEYWIENTRTWDGTRLAEDPRQTEWRIALDGDALFERGSAHASLQRILADPGTDDWRVSGEGRWTW